MSNYNRKQIKCTNIRGNEITFLELHKEEKKQLQEYLLKELGFCLEKSDIEILITVLGEDGILSDVEETNKLFKALKKISGQAEDMGLYNVNEVKIMCRKNLEKNRKSLFLMVKIQKL